MNNSECKILIVEDDAPIRKLMSTTLKANGYVFKTAASGIDAERELTSYQPDVVLLDLGLPDMDGVEIIKTLRSWSEMPVIVVSARSEDTDKIKALDAGADDYLTKPFSVNELLARIRVAQRRLAASERNNDSEPVFVNGDLKIDYAAGTAYLEGEELQLTPIEYKLLCLMAKNVGKVLTHTFITDHIWGNSLESDVATLRVFVVSLRKKIEKNPSDPQYIQTHIGIGYRMNRL
ncbi:MAG: response regulator transcription factor [Lachnospiraceae bacterium]|nr:response regulator transcription factor [Lachnospiraceae bacterium]